MENYSYIRENYLNLTQEISQLSEKHGNKVTLVAVTKSGSDEELCALASSGAVDIGENRPQELARRGGLLRDKGFSPRLHEIGNLQRNKVKSIIEDVYLIHSLDSYPLALEIDKHTKRVGRKIPVLIEINSAREEAKGGILPEDCEEFYLKLSELDSLEISGIMTMGPVCDNAEDMRPYFKLTKEIFDNISKKHGFKNGGILSMGMSDSYKVAIEEGATLVRVGRMIFNKR